MTVAGGDPAVGNGQQGGRSRIMAMLVVSLFFGWGFITVLNDPLIAKLKGLFQLGYADAMLTQFAFFLGYFIFSVPAGVILVRLVMCAGSSSDWSSWPSATR